MLPPTPKQIQDAADLGFHYTSTDPNDGSYLYHGHGLALHLTPDSTSCAIIVASVIAQTRAAERLNLLDQLAGAARAFHQALHS